MYILKRVGGLLSLVVLATLMLSIGSSPVVEADGKGNHIGNKFVMVENQPLTPQTDASGSGKLSFNTKKGEFDLTVQAQGLEPGATYHVRQTIRNGTAGNVPALATLFDVAVQADSNGDIKVARKHVSLEILSIPGIDENGRRIDTGNELLRGGQVVRHNRVRVVRSVLVDMPDSFVKIIDRYYGKDQIEVFCAEVLIIGRLAAGDDLVRAFAAAKFDTLSHERRCQLRQHRLSDVGMYE